MPAVANGVHVQGAATIIVLVIIVAIIVGIVYAVRRGQQRKQSRRPTDNWPSPPAEREPQDRPPWR